MSERAWHLVSKMTEREKVERRKQQRRDYRSRVRQSLLMTDYVYYKYRDIYTEAAAYYNQLNERYPTKYDLRKTQEFINLKRHMIGEQVKTANKLPKPSHANIQTPIQVPNEHTVRLIFDENQLTNPESPSNPESPASPESPSNPEPPASPESPSNPEPPASPESPLSPESPPTPGKFLIDIQQRSGKRMQLKIPLMKPPGVTTQTLQTVTEEVLQEGSSIQPSLYEEISPEVLEKIINKLRAEPDLQTIMTEIEKGFEQETLTTSDQEFQQLGMDIDIDENCPLENELELW